MAKTNSVNMLVLDRHAKVSTVTSSSDLRLRGQRSKKVKFKKKSKIHIYYIEGSTLMQLGQMDAQKYKQQVYGGFDLRGQSSRVKGQILKMLRLS